MSVIWRARDEVLDRLVALKVLAPSLAADARFRGMVREEARAAAQLVHPHLTSVHDYGETVDPDGSITSFVVMELLSGEELELRLTEGPLPWAEAIEVGAQVAEALAAAHRLGIVHRDVTPANVMMTATGVKVLDFGIATRIGAPDEDEDGETFGTPAYVAPERLDGAPAQPSTDVYSLGVLLHEASPAGSRTRRTPGSNSAPRWPTARRPRSPTCRTCPHRWPGSACAASPATRPTGRPHGRSPPCCATSCCPPIPRSRPSGCPPSPCRRSRPPCQQRREGQPPVRSGPVDGWCCCSSWPSV